LFVRNKLLHLDKITIQMNVSKAIKTLRKKKGIKQYQLAKDSGINQAYLSLIENGHREPTVKTIRDISNALGVPAEIMLWYSIDQNDVSPDKLEAYVILKPTIDEMINSIWG
jgi:transcriptional regulator with XRE-family HTH domain